MENLSWGLQITVLGMGLVFGLLVLLWGFLTLLLKLDREPAPECVAAAAAGVEGQARSETAPAPVVQEGLPADLAAAILIATLSYRKSLRRQAAPHMRTYWPGSQLFASRWVAAGRARQNCNWQPRGKR